MPWSTYDKNYYTCSNTNIYLLSCPTILKLYRIYTRLFVSHSILQYQKRVWAIIMIDTFKYDLHGSIINTCVTYLLCVSLPLLYCYPLK